MSCVLDAGYFQLLIADAGTLLLSRIMLSFNDRIFGSSYPAAWIRLLACLEILLYVMCIETIYIYGWCLDVMVNALVTINEVTLCRAQLVPGWVTICGQVNHLSM